MTVRPLGGRTPGWGLLAAVALLLPAAAREGGAAEAAKSPLPVVGRRVLLVTTDPAGEIAAAVLTRMRGELRAARFEMDVATISVDAPRRGSVEEMATRGGATAALGIFFAADRVEMWAADASAGRTLMQNLPLDPGAPARRATIVAVKAVDLLKATLAEIWSIPPTDAVDPATAEPLVVRSPEIGVPAPPAIAASDQDAERFQDRWGITAGGGRLQAGSASGWSPLLAIMMALGRGRWAGRLTLSGPGTSSEVSKTAGSARLTQDVGLVELLVRTRVWHGWRAALAIGAGAHRLSIDGQGTAPDFSGVDHQVWSLATSAGAGVTLDLSSRVVVALDARAVENLPATAVRIDGVPAAHVGRPIVWLALAAGVRFP